MERPANSWRRYGRSQGLFRARSRIPRVRAKPYSPRITIRSIPRWILRQGRSRNVGETINTVSSDDPQTRGAGAVRLFLMVGIPEAEAAPELGAATRFEGDATKLGGDATQSGSLGSTARGSQSEVSVLKSLGEEKNTAGFKASGGPPYRISSTLLRSARSKMSGGQAIRGRCERNGNLRSGLAGSTLL